MRSFVAPLLLLPSIALANSMAAIPYGAAVPFGTVNTVSVATKPRLAGLRWVPGDIGQALTQEAEKRGIAPDLAHAVAAQESGGNPSAISRAGAVGVMQLMPDTAERYGVTDRRDPLQSIRGGLDYLKDLLAMFKGNKRLALAGFNAGEGKVIKHGYKIPPYPETQRYVAAICARVECR